MRILKFGGLIPIVLFSLIKHIEEDRYFIPIFTISFLCPHFFLYTFPYKVKENRHMNSFSAWFKDVPFSEREHYSTVMFLSSNFTVKAAEANSTTQIGCVRHENHGVTALKLLLKQQGQQASLSLVHSANFFKNPRKGNLQALNTTI